MVKESFELRGTPISETEPELKNFFYRRARLNWLRGNPLPGLTPWLAFLARRFCKGRLFSFDAILNHFSF